MLSAQKLLKSKQRGVLVLFCFVFEGGEGGHDQSEVLVNMSSVIGQTIKG